MTAKISTMPGKTLPNVPSIGSPQQPASRISNCGVLGASHGTSHHRHDLTNFVLFYSMNFLESWPHTLSIFRLFNTTPFVLFSFFFLWRLPCHRSWKRAENRSNGPAEGKKKSQEEPDSPSRFPFVNPAQDLCHQEEEGGRGANLEQKQNKQHTGRASH